MFFQISAALNSPLGLCLGAQTVHRRAEIVSLSADLGIPEMLKAPLAKIYIRSKIRQWHLRI
jgi:hypothetical protein